MDIERQNFLKECEPRQTFEQFKEKVDELLMSTYGITTGDCTDDEQLNIEFKDGTTAEDFVEFIANKRDLDPINSKLY